MPDHTLDEHRIKATLERRPRALPRREFITEAILAVIVLAGMGAFALLAEPARALSVPLAIAFVAVYALVQRLELQVGDGNLAPTHVVFVPMLLLLPTPVVPVLVLVAMLCGYVVNVARGRRAAGRVLLAINDSASAIAPALVLVALGAQTPEWDLWPAYAAALAVQFAADTVRETLRTWLGLKIPPRVVLVELLHAFRVDAVLAPIGLLAALAAASAPAAALLVLPLVYLLSMFSHEREARIEQMLELGHAYRGTALLLRDLLEEDDEYTGNHTEDVVDLAVRVADQLGADPELRRGTEFGALLHDIGKIAIPDSIINKPGPLDDEEWALMRTHTIEGQRMLDQVGGLLGSVGVVVRASHENFDGTGYPDGLAGEAIPLAARVVTACDAFSAMTTTRSYRAGIPIAAAVEELRRCSGTQFDPRVVDALLAVVADPGWQQTAREPAVDRPPVAV